MSDDDPRIEAFFAEAPRWRAELAALRQILRIPPLVEAWKWDQPVYTHAGGNVATLHGFKDAVALGFFKGVLLPDPEGILVPPGPNSRAARVVRFADRAEIEAQAPILAAYLRAAVEVEARGLKVDFPKDDLDYPEELVERLDADPALAEAFAALTPGRRRGWLLHFSQPKQAQTRANRIDKATPKILAGQGMHDR